MGPAVKLPSRERRMGPPHVSVAPNCPIVLGKSWEALLLPSGVSAILRKEVSRSERKKHRLGGGLATLWD